jgi:hypothetical protein
MYPTGNARRSNASQNRMTNASSRGEYGMRKALVLAGTWPMVETVLF